MTKPVARPKKLPAKTTNTKMKAKQAWVKKLLALRYAKPLLFVVIFMLVGLTGLWWAKAATTSYSIWDASAVPQTLSASDTRSTELGLKFQAKVAGEITGVRFYKSAQNTGTHTGSLWSSSGQLLARATFTNETSSGWQEVAFSQPVSISANATYIVSYHAPKGHYSTTNGYFGKTAYTHNDLVALKSSTSGPNGVYKYATGSAFPNKNLQATNFWVDVVFRTQLIDPNPGPAAPTGLTATQQDTSHVALSWQPSISANPISEYVIYRGGNRIASAGTNTSYLDATVSVGNTYSYQVKAIDNTGASSVLSNPVSITIQDGSSGGTSYVQPGTVGYLGNTSALTVIDSTHPYAGTGGSTWSSANGNTFSQANLTLDHVWVKGSLFWTGTGTLTITNSIIEGGTQDYTIRSESTTPTTVSVSDSTLKWPGTPRFPTGSDNANITANSRFVQILRRDDISGQPHGVELTGSNSIVDSNWIHDLAYTSASYDPHLDGIFVFGGSNQQILNNYVLITGSTNNYAYPNSSDPRSDTSQYATAALFFQNTFGYGISSPVVKGNYLKGGSGSYKQEAGTNADVENNIMDKGYCGFAFNPNTGLCDDVQFSGGTIATWLNNKHSDGTVVARPQ